MKHVFLTLFTIGIFSPLSFAQLILVQQSHSGAIPTGPALESSPLHLMLESDNGTYKIPDLATSVSFQLSNMQMKADGVKEVISLGTSYRETMKWPSSEPVFQPMRAIGKSLSKWFNEEEDENGIVTVGTQHGIFAFASIKHLSASHNPTAGEKIYYGDMILTFNRPVSNPLLHFAGMGGLVEKDGVIRGFSVEMELMTPAASLEKTAGTDNFDIQPNYIGNNMEFLSPYCGTGAACGTTRVLGRNLQTLHFKVYLRRDRREDGYRHKWPLMRNMHWGDGWVMSVSFEQDLNLSGNLHMAGAAKSKNKADGQLLYVNLIDPVTDLVLASQPISDDGSFTISGITGYQSYDLQMSMLRGIAGQKKTESVLPESWNQSAAGPLQSLYNPAKKLFTVKFENQDVNNLQWTLQSPNSPEIVIEQEVISEKTEITVSNVLPEPLETFDVSISNESPAENASDPEVVRTQIETEQASPRSVLTRWQEEKETLREEDCFVIVGSFLMDYNVQRMERRLVDEEYDTYVLPGPPRGDKQFTRVGYKIKCEEKDKNLASARRKIDPKSWFLQYEWTPSYGMHYQSKSLWYFNITTSGMDIDISELNRIISSKR